MKKRFIIITLLFLFLLSLATVAQAKTSESWLDKTEDKSVAYVTGSVYITGSLGKEAGYNEGKEVYSKEFSVSYSTPKTAAVEAAIKEATQLVNGIASDLKKDATGEYHMSTTEKTIQIYDHRKYDTLYTATIGSKSYQLTYDSASGTYKSADSSIEYDSKTEKLKKDGVEQADDAFTVSITHLATGSYGKETSYIVEASGWVNGITTTLTVEPADAGTASASPAAAKAGAVITLTASSNTGYQFREWQVLSGGVTVADNKFTIGSANVEIKAVFEKTQEPPKEDPPKEEDPGAPFVNVKEKLTIKNAQPTTVTAEINPNDSIAGVVSSKKKIATVKFNGTNIIITPKKAGKTTVTITTAMGATAKIQVTVKKGASLNQKKITLKKGKTFKIKAYSIPTNIKAKFFSSSKPDVAQVDKTGKVKALKKGKAVITVTLTNGKKLRLKVTVK